ncbi:MAG: LysR family transcriptional regulator [Oscillospiraceae bacterium]|nr:LysR family transcriptional regulator [Oscillospiraceae bacterium]
MDTLQLKLFLSLSKTLNFTKTANEFYVTQPTVSNYVKSLESSIGVKLLNRDSHSVSLTPEGQEFVRYANRLIALQNEAEERIRNLAGGRRGFIRIAMLSSAAALFSEFLGEYASKYPEVQVNVDLLEGSEMMEALIKNNYDLYLCHEHMLPETDSIAHAVISRARLTLFVNKADAPAIDMNDWSSLSHLRFVSTPAEDFTLSMQINKMCAKRGISPDVINFYNRADMALIAVNSGVGVAILPPQLTDFYKCENVVGLPIEGDDANIFMVIAWRKDSGNDDARNFLSLDSLKKHFDANKEAGII